VFKVSVEVDDTAPKICILLSEAPDFIEADLNFLPVLVPNIAKRARVENLGLEALYISLLNSPEYRV
jgi:hypothetical protein